MQSLIIILIVTLIALACIFIYANIIDMTDKRNLAALNKQMADMQERFNEDIKMCRRTFDVKDDILKQWISKASELDCQLDEARKVNGLLKGRTNHIEGLKDSFNQVAEASWYLHKNDLKKGETARECYVEGMKAGAEWIAECVGVKVDFEIDERFKENK